MPAHLPGRRSAAGPHRGFQTWLARVPRLTEDLLQEWDLSLDGASWAGSTAVVLPVRTADGRPAALKLAWPHPEAAHEHLALRAWHGEGAVRLWRADPSRGALLLERAGPDLLLSSARSWAACEIVGGLYRSLHRPALPQLTRLSTLASAWGSRLDGVSRHPQVPRRLAVQAAATLRELVAADCDTALLHGDLHDANVLAATPATQGREWLAIDPKPLAGDPHLEPAPLLWNRWAEVVASSNARSTLRSRLAAVVDAAGLDEDKARAWCLVRVMMNLAWAVSDGSGDGEWLTRNTVVAKALAS